MKPVWLSACLATGLLFAGCASAASHPHSFESPGWSGGAAVPPGAAVWVSAKGTSLGASSAPLTVYTHGSGDLKPSLRPLLKAQQRLAAESFRVAADSLVLRIASQVPAARVRRVIEASIEVGFRSLWLVGRDRAGHESAVRLVAQRSLATARHDIAFRWGNMPMKIRQASAFQDLRRAVGFEGIEVATVTRSGTGADYEVVGTSELSCPAVPYAEGTGGPVVDAVGPIAKQFCDATPGAGIVAVSPLPSTPWGEVVTVATAAMAANGCRWSLFLEPADSRPKGCAGYLLAHGLGGALAKQSRDSRLAETQASLEALKQRVLRRTASSTHSSGQRVPSHVVGKARAGRGLAAASPGPPKPTVRLLKNNPTVSGGCDLQSVEGSLRRREAAFLKCHRQTLGGRSVVFQGDITLTFKLPPAGRPIQIETPRVSSGLERAAKCVREVAKQMRIRPSKRSCRVQRVLRYRKALDPHLKALEAKVRTTSRHGRFVPRRRRGTPVDSGAHVPVARPSWKGASTPRGRVTSGPVAVEGACGTKGVRALLKRRLAAFQYCYDRAFPGSTHRAGRIGLRLTIGPKGTVTLATAKAGASALDGVAACFQTVARRLEFAPPRKGLCLVRTQMLLAPPARPVPVAR